MDPYATGLLEAHGCAAIPVILNDVVSRGSSSALRRRMSLHSSALYSVVFRYPKDYVVRRDGSPLSLLRLRCGHHHLTIRSAAECKERLAHRPIGIGHIIGRFGKVEEIATHRVVTDAEIAKARATELDMAEAFRIVLNLAKENIKAAKTNTKERARGNAACDIVEKFVVRLR
jgi:hypothetical protein